MVATGLWIVDFSELLDRSWVDPLDEFLVLFVEVFPLFVVEEGPSGANAAWVGAEAVELTL